MIGNIKKLFPPRTGMQKKQVLQDPGYVRGAEGPCCMLHAILQLAHVKGVKRNKKKQNRFDLRSLFPMSEVSESLYENIYIRLHLRSLFVKSEVLKALYTYINRMKPLHPSMYTQ